MIESSLANFLIASQSVLSDFESDSLCKVPFGDLDLLPQEPGVYFAVGANRNALYIGKADNLRRRCNSLNDVAITAQLLNMGLCGNLKDPNTGEMLQLRGIDAP